MYMYMYMYICSYNVQNKESIYINVMESGSVKSLVKYFI